MVKSMKQFRDTPYLVNDSGQVFRVGKAKCLKPDTSPKGYQRVTLCIDGKTERFLVHRIVAEVFLGLDPDREYVNHKDSTPSNNHVTNLEWCTHSENMLHSHAAGTCSNQLASSKASEIKTLETELKFRDLLGKNFIRVENIIPRNFVVFNCPSCSKEMKCRVDSSTLHTFPISCKACKVKMKI